MTTISSSTRTVDRPRPVESRADARISEGPAPRAAEAPAAVEPEVHQGRPDPEVQAQSREVSRIREASLRQHFDVDGPAPDPSFTERIVELDRAQAVHLADRVAEWGGVERPNGLGTITLAPGPVAERAGIAGSLAHQLDAARTAGDLDSAGMIEERIGALFGDGSLPAIDAALTTAADAGPRPAFFSPANGYSAGEPHSVALQDALQPLAAQSIYQRHVGPENAAALDAAYEGLSPERRAQLDAELTAIANDRNFFEGAGQALADTGSDLLSTGELVWNLSTDPNARAQFAGNVSDIAEAVSDPERRAEALEMIGTELGAGLVDAFENFGDDPDYYTGYLAGTLAAGGAVGRLARVGAVAARLGGVRAIDLASRVRVDVDASTLGMNGGNFRFRLDPHRGPQSAAERGLRPGFEHRLVMTSSVDARRAATELAGLGDNSVPFVSQMGPLQGRVVGRASPDGLRGWRLDFDSDNQEFHVNWWDRSEGPGRRADWRYGEVAIEGGTENDLYDLLDHAFDNRPTD